jgi:hypothetical protein
MDKDFHQNIVLTALRLMPVSFQSFLICPTYTLEQLQIDSDLPDLVDHDNIESDPLCRHDHSYKMQMQEGKLVWTDGGAIERIVSLCEDAHDFHAEGKYDLVRYCLGKMTHYRVDSLTFPHLFHGKPWSLYHAKFEDEMGRFILKHETEIEGMAFTAYKDISKDCLNTTIAAWPIGEEVVQKYKDGIKLTDEEMLDIVKICIQGIGDLWTTLMQELKI